MPRTSPRKDLNLRWLELFQICARKGSLQAAADETGLSVSTVSHHLKNLEDHLGVALFDHTRRPMVVTPKGRAFLRNIDDALQMIRKAKAEASAGNVSDASFFRVGSIEDFDSDIAPELAVFLSRQMPECDFLYHTGSSHEVIEMLRNRELDLGISTSPPERLRDLQDRPLLRDPFIIVAPASVNSPVSDILSGSAEVPLLRFSSDLLVSQQIEAQLRRLGLDLPHRFEFGSTQTLLAMVAAGAGWTIITPLMFSRGRRFHQKLRLYAFPGKSFSRTLSIVTTPDCSRSIRDLIDQRLRASLQAQLITPFLERAPWLTDRFSLID